MADVETQVRRLQVANLPPADSGRGIARLPTKFMTELGLADGDVVEIVGKRSTPARAVRPYGDDEGLDIIRLDGLQRANAGVGSGDFVEVQKASSKPATRVVFAPAQNSVRLQGSSEALKRSFAGRPLTPDRILCRVLLVGVAGRGLTQQRIGPDPFQGSKPPPDPVQLGRVSRILIIKWFMFLM